MGCKTGCKGEGRVLRDSVKNRRVIVEVQGGSYQDMGWDGRKQGCEQEAKAYKDRD